MRSTRIEMKQDHLTLSSSVSGKPKKTKNPKKKQKNNPSVKDKRFHQRELFFYLLLYCAPAESGFSCWCVLATVLKPCKRIKPGGPLGRSGPESECPKTTTKKTVGDLGDGCPGTYRFDFYSKSNITISRKKKNE